MLELIFWATIGSVFSLIGGVALVKAAGWRTRIIRYALPFGAGALLAAAFYSVLPEALHGVEEPTAILAWALGGFLTFFVLERLLGWFHHHHHHGGEDEVRNRTHVALVIIGDTLHNAIDGIAIAAAFLVNPVAGVATAIAVAAHEIPQEIGDFGILLGKGVRPRNAIIINLLSAAATVIAAIVTYALGASLNIDPAPLLAIAAGFFIYIAASDIIPDIHERPRREGNRQAIMLLVGVVVIVLTTLALPHSHDNETDTHDNHSNEHHSAETHGGHDELEHSH